MFGRVSDRGRFDLSRRQESKARQGRCGGGREGAQSYAVRLRHQPRPRGRHCRLLQRAAPLRREEEEQAQELVSGNHHGPLPRSRPISRRSSVRRDTPIRRRLGTGRQEVSSRGRTHGEETSGGESHVHRSGEGVESARRRRGGRRGRGRGDGGGGGRRRRRVGLGSSRRIGRRRVPIGTGAVVLRRGRIGIAPVRRTSRRPFADVGVGALRAPKEAGSESYV
mmetsp:Transcript_43379/g.131963  ORF Transcript_43379/g.131963 Transcript_43379/m.131963 type:complete len:223 (-) Transcript_43379:411-1079(-)